MFKDEKKCDHCGDKMEEGFILDFHYGGQTASRWITGKPQKTRTGVAAYTDRQNYHISAFRCESCGHLDFFATDEFFHSP